jgi:hypothetical protein
MVTRRGLTSFGAEVIRSRKLGTQLGVGIETEIDRRLARVLQTPNGILDWIAVPNFLAMRA